jgi:hypothetical protein
MLSFNFLLKSNDTLNIASGSVRMEIVVDAKFQTKDWRRLQIWYTNGKRTECEKYQFWVLASYGIAPKKTKDRINLRTLEITQVQTLKSRPDGFEFSETFDGLLKDKDYALYFNLRFITSDGGAQTRSMRETYHFIEAQHRYLDKNPTWRGCFTHRADVSFANILDGDACSKSMVQFSHLEQRFPHHRGRCFTGDTKGFIPWHTFCRVVRDIKRTRTGLIPSRLQNKIR